MRHQEGARGESLGKSDSLAHTRPLETWCLYNYYLLIIAPCQHQFFVVNIIRSNLAESVLNVIKFLIEALLREDKEKWRNAFIKVILRLTLWVASELNGDEHLKKFIFWPGRSNITIVTLQCYYCFSIFQLHNFVFYEESISCHSKIPSHDIFLLSNTILCGKN